jgi:hypothetical protein
LVEVEAEEVDKVLEAEEGDMNQSNLNHKRQTLQ